MNIHGPRAIDRIVLPYLIQQLVAAQRGAAMFDEISKQLEFASGEDQQFSLANHLRLPEIYLDRSESERAFGWFGFDAGAP